MNQPDPYPPIERWIIPAEAARASLRGVRPAGRRGLESGAFWLGRRGAIAEVKAVLLPQGAGVVERPDMWQVSPEVFGEMSRWALVRGLVMIAMLHIHVGHSARMSRWDRERVVQVPDMLSVIVPQAGMSDEYQEWSWYVFEQGDYRELPSPEITHRITFTPDECSCWIVQTGSVEECPP